jgi:hypothetical protein
MGSEALTNLAEDVRCRTIFANMATCLFHRLSRLSKPVQNGKLHPGIETRRAIPPLSR